MKYYRNSANNPQTVWVFKITFICAAALNIFAIICFAIIKFKSPEVLPENQRLAAIHHLLDQSSQPNASIINARSPEQLYQFSELGEITITYFDKTLSSTLGIGISICVMNGVLLFLLYILNRAGRRNAVTFAGRSLPDDALNEGCIHAGGVTAPFGQGKTQPPL